MTAQRKVDTRTLNAARELAADADYLGFAVQTRVHTAFKHIEGNPLVLELEIEDQQKRKHRQEMMLFPEDAEDLARRLLLGLARLGRTFAGEELQDD